MKKSNICCIIVTYNIGEKFNKCFFSIKNQVDKIVIVDNGSDKITLEYIDKLKEEYDVEVIKNEENMGIAYALNQGVKYALEHNYDWILTMDHDSEATNNMISTMIEEYTIIDSDNRKMIMGLFPKNIDKNLLHRVKTETINNEEKTHYVECEICSGNLLKKEVFYNVGMFNEELFIDFVDTEFCYRIITKGYKLLKVENAKLLHKLGDCKEGRFLGKKATYTNHSSIRRYYITRNRFYTWSKFKNLGQTIREDKRAFIKESIKILLFEEEKFEKFKMILKGFKDYKKNSYGKMRG